MQGVELEYEEEQVSGEEDSIRKKRQLVESYRYHMRTTYIRTCIYIR